MRIGDDVEEQLAVLCLVTERPRNRFQQCAEEDFFRFDRNRSRFDLRQIENVADQVEQVGAGAVNRARKFHLLWRQAAIRIFRKLLAQHQNAVERRAQLVRHVGQELRFVLRSQRQFAGLFFQCAPRLLDLLVLAFHFVVLFGQLLGLLRELLVGLLQFLLLRLQLGGQLLRLLQQAFSLHGGFNRVEHDADAAVSCSRKARCEAVNELEAGQLDHRLDAIFKQHRQHDHVLAAAP